jgi:GT2 family glycosyltransferase/acetyltransferase-like isoleucine patch superfamily enzyme
MNLALFAHIQRLQDAGNPIPWQPMFFTGDAESWLDLGCNDGRTHRGFDRSKTTVAELFLPSVEQVRTQGFAEVLHEDMRTVAARFASEGRQFERVTAYDVIEHIPKEDGYQVLAALERIATRQIVLMIPIETPELAATQQFKDFRESGLSQHPDEQRELHDHKSQWAPDDLRALGYEVAVLTNFHGFFDAMVGVKCVDQADLDRIIDLVSDYDASAPNRQEWGYLGIGTNVADPWFVNGQNRIFLGDRVSIGGGARIEAIAKHDGDRYNGQIIIEDGVSIEMMCHIGAAGLVRIGRDVMIGGHVTILDHDHGYGEMGRPPRYQALDVKPTTIEDNCWIGEYAFVGKGITVGHDSIVGAHAVVLSNVPPYHVAVGNPARVLPRKYAPLGLTSIIIPTCGGVDDLSRCLASIARYTREPIEIIVVDNGKRALDAHYPLELGAVAIISNETNRGFAAACNQGLQRAKGDYLLVLNDDTEVSEGWLSRLLGTLQRYPQVGLVGPVSNYVAGEQLVKESYDHRLHWGQTQEVDGLIGFCLLMRREVYSEIGGFDERFGLGNFDDNDFCLRASLAGWQMRIVRDCFVYHKGGQTFQRLGIDYAESLKQNEALFREKWQEVIAVGG